MDSATNRINPSCLQMACRVSSILVLGLSCWKAAAVETCPIFSGHYRYAPTGMCQGKRPLRLPSAEGFFEPGPGVIKIEQTGCHSISIGKHDIALSTANQQIKKIAWTENSLTVSQALLPVGAQLGIGRQTADWTLRLTPDNALSVEHKFVEMGLALYVLPFRESQRSECTLPRITAP